ncbi:MAG: adenylate/guanylate cyclase domain-containing protein, partial [Roseivivax sp.]|nr:adenylate/guanylate cyclase domain-containing protein [Roseivivax sp.]
AGEPLRFRIGIHLGDVIVDGTDLLGDGVNLAARLQSMAEPGGVLISRQVYEQVRAKLTVGFEYLGERRPKNLAEDVEIYRIAIGGAASGPPRAWSVLGAPAAGGVAPWGDWQSRVLRLARPYALGAAVLLGVDLLTGPGVWAQWPILVIAVAFGWQAAPYLQRGPIQARTIRAAVAIAALCLANLFTWDGYFWAIWPALGIVLLHILRRTRKTES